MERNKAKRARRHAADEAAEEEASAYVRVILKRLSDVVNRPKVRDTRE